MPREEGAAGRGGRALAPAEGRSGAGRGAQEEAALQEGKGLKHGGEGLRAAPGAQIPNRRNSCFASNSSAGSEADFMTYLFILSLMNRRLI